MSANTKLIEIVILFVLTGISFFNMPSNEQSEGRKMFCGVVCTISILYYVYFLFKSLLSIFFVSNGEWIFSQSRISNFVGESVEYIFWVVVGIVVWVWLGTVLHNR